MHILCNDQIKVMSIYITSNITHFLVVRTFKTYSSNYLQCIILIVIIITNSDDTSVQSNARNYSMYLTLTLYSVIVYQFKKSSLEAVHFLKFSEFPSYHVIYPFSVDQDL